MAELDEPTAAATAQISSAGPGTALVRVAGELDLSSVPGIEAELEPLIQATPERLLFDLGAVTFMDSSGIAMLLRAAKAVPDTRVRNPSAAVLLVIEATGLHEFLHVEP